MSSKVLTPIFISIHGWHRSSNSNSIYVHFILASVYSSFWALNPACIETKPRLVLPNLRPESNPWPEGKFLLCFIRYWHVAYQAVAKNWLALCLFPHPPGNCMSICNSSYMVTGIVRESKKNFHINYIWKQSNHDPVPETSCNNINPILCLDLSGLGQVAELYMQGIFRKCCMRVLDMMWKTKAYASNQLWVYHFLLSSLLFFIKINFICLIKGHLV